MTDNSKRPKDRGRALPALNLAIDSLNIAKEATSTTPVNPVFGSVAALLTMIRVSSLSFRSDIWGSHVDRTRWPTIRISLTLDCLASIFARLLSGESMESH